MQLAQTSAALTQREEALAQLQSALAAAEARIAAADAGAEETLRLRTALEGAEKRAAALDADVAKLTAARAEAGRLHQGTANELRATQEALSVLTETVSWRVTQPLRFVRGRQLKLAARAADILAAVKLRGGLVPALLKTARIVRLEGLRGLKLRWDLLEGEGGSRPAPEVIPSGRPLDFEGRSPLEEQKSGSAEAPKLVTSPALLFPDEPPEVIDCSVSVIIPTLNAGPEFEKLLRKLRQQAGVARIEIIVVDSGSTDETLAHAAEFECKVVVIDKASFTHSYARNLGASHATGELLLFTVQDAFPIGDYWLHALVSTLVNSRKANPKLAALSCAEYPRTDSELMYDCAIDTHYEFLSCSNQDRVGTLGDADHMALRSQGQLSDVACLIPSDIFKSFEYEGSYAEDLDLGIRLLRSGYNVAMLSSIKVIHSHNRDPSYHLRRSCTDVVFLARKFHDFTMPNVLTFRGAVVGAARILAQLDAALARPSQHVRPRPYIDDLCARCLGHAMTDAGLEGVDVSFGCQPFAQFVGRRDLLASTQLSAAEKHDVRAFADLFCARLKHIGTFAERVYPLLDERVRAEVHAATLKTLASTLGIQLGFGILRAERRASNEDFPEAEALLEIMTGGI